MTKLLKDLGWKDLVNRRREQRLLLLYRIMYGHLAVPPKEVDLIKSERSSRKGSHALVRPSGSRPSSPLWKSTVFRTIPEWYNLPSSVAEADSLTSFKSRLAALSP